MKQSTAPHYLLFTEAKDLKSQSVFGGRWRFVLEEIGSDIRIEEAEVEPGVMGERLQLLVVIRGLEALHQPSRVTLITPSRYVGRGIRMGLSQWRENNWRWESFGLLKTINHVDLWRRVSQAMEIHQINCRVWHFDPPQSVSDSNAAQNSEKIGHKFGPTPFSTDTPNVSAESPAVVMRSTQSMSTTGASNSSGYLGPLVKPIGQGRAFGYAVY